MVNQQETRERITGLTTLAYQSKNELGMTLPNKEPSTEENVHGEQGNPKGEIEGAPKDPQGRTVRDFSVRQIQD